MPTVTNNITVSAVGASILNSADPSAVSWIRVNADNTITYRNAAQTLSDLGAQAAGTYLVPADIGVTVQGYNANTTILGNSVTGSGNIVLATSPTIATSLTLSYGTASTVVYLNASNQLISLANGSGVLTNDGSGGLTWAAASSGITINSTVITGGTAGRVLFENASNQVSQDLSYSFDNNTATTFNTIFAPGKVSAGFSATQVSLFGYNAGAATTTGAPIVAVGFFALNTHTDGGNNVAVGHRAMQSGNSSNTVVLGNSAGANITKTANIFIGNSAGANNAFSSCIIIAHGGMTTTAANQGILGGNGSTTQISDWYFNGVTHTAPYSVVLHACHGSGSNVAAANFTISGGAATGTGAGGYVKTTTSVKRASGTTQQVDTDRNVIVGKYVDITESAATTYGTLALTTSGTIAGGTIIYTIEANDGTDYQSLTGNAVYSVVNKAGTLTVTFTDLTQALAESAGGSTLTSTMTATVSGTSVLFQANAVSSLVQTTLRISFQVLNNFGQAIVTPA